ncbi:hypothetical protein PTTG_05416 [Puccinia triticina 1-1 BBBD Race 1]|uniref:Alpha N-terminal protein methyltransferase 1 n=1 Tax=Puccinia triticina (isolate 1-1 / race 1 (BBBD)) TaxID=630390 RepID=A0A180GQE8_PUCT1|nr:hypothetical protein PTTG_05416 [Puccinia triticina 1-1 BBBD Race 1]
MTSANGTPAPVEEPPRPDIHAGLAYWNSVAQQDLTNNAVLGGFGLGVSARLSTLTEPILHSLPRVDAMGSRMFLLTIRPELSKIKPPYQTSHNPSGGAEQKKNGGGRRLYRALDVGAGIGRVTGDVLLYLFDRIDLVEPIAGFIETGKRNALSGKWLQLRSRTATVAHLSSPSAPIMIADSCAIVGSKDGWNDGCGYDVIWAQWTLGHLSDEELVEFLKKCKDSLRPAASPHSTDQSDRALEPPTFEKDGGLIIIKENIYISKTDPDGDNFLFDKQDSSLTRSHQSFLRIFKLAGLRLIKQEIQRGFDPDLYRVNFYALQ